MTKFTASEIRQHFSEIINRVAYGGERIVLQRRGGKDLVALVPITDLEALEAIEDQLDIQAAKKALAESDERVPYSDARRELGLDK